MKEHEIETTDQLYWANRDDSVDEHINYLFSPTWGVLEKGRC